VGLLLECIWGMIGSKALDGGRDRTLLRCAFYIGIGLLFTDCK